MKERLFHSFKIFERVEIDTSEYCLASVKQVIYQLLPYKSAVTMMLIYGIGLGMIFRLISKYRVRRTQKQVKNLCKARKIKVSQKISTHLLIIKVDFCPVLCVLEVPVLQTFRGISHFVWYCKAVSDLS